MPVKLESALLCTHLPLLSALTGHSSISFVQVGRQISHSQPDFLAGQELQGIDKQEKR